MLRKGIEATPNWLKVKEPRDVRLVIELVLFNEISKTAQEVNAVFSTPTAGGTVSSSPSSPVLTSDGGGRATGLQQQQQRNNNNNNTSSLRTNTGYQPSTSSSGGSVRKNPSMGNLAGTLFDKKVNIFANVELNATSVIIGIVNIGLKVRIAHTRTHTHTPTPTHTSLLSLSIKIILLFSSYLTFK